MNQAKIAMHQMSENLGDAQVFAHNVDLEKTLWAVGQVVKQGQDVIKHLQRLKKAYGKGATWAVEAMHNARNAG